MKRLIAIAVSATILVIIWASIDPAAIARAFTAANPFWLVLGLAAVVPITYVTAVRFRMLTGADLGVWSAMRLILSASTLNAFLPSKMGDIAKAWVLRRRYGYGGEHALSLVILEKMLDMGSLLLWGSFACLWLSAGKPILLLGAAATLGGLALIVLLILPSSPAVRIASRLPGKIGKAARSFSAEWQSTVAGFWAHRRRAAEALGTSIGLWALHLAQFWLFARSLNPAIPFLDNMAFATLAILVGLLPFTMAGIGTRDAAIILFYSAWLRPAEGAVLGVLATSRYLIPAFAGLPFVRDYWEGKRAVDA